MKTHTSPIEPTIELGSDQLEFGVSAEGFPVARLGDCVFAMVPAPSRTGAILAHSYREQRPLAELKRDDFYCFETILADEAAFRARVIETAEHRRELRKLNRRDVRWIITTLWGPSRNATVYADGVIFHKTAFHGGFHLSPERNAMVHPLLCNDTRYYEEGAASASVALSFPQLFTAYERLSAERTIKNRWPKTWEMIIGPIHGPADSHEKARQAFAEAHAADWVVTTSAISSHEKGFVEVVATLGGQRDGSHEQRRFLVPWDEYEIGRFGLVIDVNRHPVYGGPSDFIDWLEWPGLDRVAN
jgi:hypothetical protein